MTRRPRYRGGRAVTPVRRFLIMTGTGMAVLAAALVLVAVWAFWSYAGPGPGARSGASTDVVLRQGAACRRSPRP